MSSLLTGAIRLDQEYGQLLQAIRKDEKNASPLPILVNGLCEGTTDALLVSLLEDQQRTQGSCVLLICAEEKDCVRLCDTLNRYGKRAAFFVGRDYTFYDITASHEYEHERLDVLFSLLSGVWDVVLTTPDSAVGYTIPPQRLLDAMLHLDMHSRVDLNELSKCLVAAGYSRAEMVDGKGQFAIRGGIIDVYAPNGCFTDADGHAHTGGAALRIELFGDEIDRMGLFDVESQRVHTAVTQADLPPAREILPDDAAKDAMLRAIAAQRKVIAGKNDKAEQQLQHEATVIEGSRRGDCDVAFADKYISLIYPEKASLLDYFTDKSWVFMLGTNNIYERLRAGEWHRNQTIQDLLESGTLSPKYAEYAKSVGAFDSFLGKQITIHVDSMSYGLSGRKMAGMFGFRTKQVVSYGDNVPLLLEDLKQYVAQQWSVVLLTENEMAAKNLQGYLSDQGLSAVLQDRPDAPSEFNMIPRGGILLLWQQQMRGFELMSAKVAVLSTLPDARSGGLSLSRTGRGNQKKKKSAAQAILSYADLSVGDYVVHETYGIGRYTGIENLTVDGVTRDYIGIQYAGSDKLFLPTEKLDKVSKYIGTHTEEGTVKLSKFSGDAWNKTKARVRASVKDIAKELIQLYAQRSRRPGFAFPADDEFQRSFDAAFEYEETEGQLHAIEDVKRDMQSSVPMERLLCGDVGFGKTEVALRAAYKAVLGGKQVAVLVPTTILALQHYQTFTSRMRAFGVHVDMISRFRTATEQSATLRRLKRGETDVLIGTHRLIGKDVAFHDLGLLIVDEEQRFGVAQKEKLKQLAGNVDVLTLSATPIPRTLNMAMGGLRDISVLDDAPGDRLPVQTYVLEEDDVILHEAIRHELLRGGQVFYLHNVVDDIDERAAALAREFPDARITVAHGKMDKDRLERIWESMLEGSIDILVCTTIIETGVDIPNANTLIVDNAHRLGLSQLHQLRGRVGRSSRRAYAYFTYPKFKALTEVAQKRLETIRDYAEFGAGFKIALRDMEIRGTGNLLGTEQHGHMDAVGYELYIKLLHAAVLTEKGETPRPEPECTVSLQLDAYIPEKYVQYPSQRMELYKKIAMIEDEKDRDDILDEMLDRFGELPRATENLLDIALIRADGKQCGIKQIRQEGAELQIYPEQLAFDLWTELAQQYTGRIRLALNGEPHLKVKLKSGERLLTFLHRLLLEYLQMAKSEQ